MNSDLQKWEAAASGWDKNIAQENTFRTLLITNALEKLIHDCTGRDILDAGCGNGYYSRWLHAKGGHVIGVDGSERMVEIARQKYPDINFKVQDLLKPTTFADGSFDIILANMLLMHMENAEIFLADARRLLRPRGQLIFSVLHPAFNQPTSVLRKSWWEKLTLAKPKAVAFDYYTREKGRFESHFSTDLTHYHRTIEEYSLAINKAGFTISSIIEPHELPQAFLNSNPKLEYATRLPRFIFFNCQ